MEVYGEKPQKFTKEWWSYIWLYYKWHIIGACVAIFMIVTTLHECATRTKYDLQITLVTEQQIMLSQSGSMRNYAESIIGDATQNGIAEAYVMPIWLSDKADAQSIQAGYAKFTVEMTMPESHVFIMSRMYADRVIEAGILEETQNWAEGAESDGYVISLKDSEKLKEMGIDPSTEELFVGVVQLFDDKKEDAVEKARYENGVLFARSLLGLE